MYEFAKLNSQKTFVSSYHVLKDGVPVAILSNHRGSGQSHSDADKKPQTWVLYRLSDHMALFDNRVFPSTQDALDYVQTLVIQDLQPKYRLTFKTAYGLSLHFSDSRYGLVQDENRALAMSRDQCLEMFEKAEDHYRPLGISIPGDWFTEVTVTNIAEGIVIQSKAIENKQSTTLYESKAAS